MTTWAGMDVLPLCSFPQLLEQSCDAWSALLLIDSCVGTQKSTGVRVSLCQRLLLGPLAHASMSHSLMSAGQYREQSSLKMVLLDF